MRHPRKSRWSQLGKARATSNPLGGSSAQSFYARMIAKRKLEEAATVSEQGASLASSSSDLHPNAPSAPSQSDESVDVASDSDDCADGGSAPVLDSGDGPAPAPPAAVPTTADSAGAAGAADVDDATPADASTDDAPADGSSAEVGMLTSEQAEGLILAVERMRRKSSNTHEFYHGWELIYQCAPSSARARAATCAWLTAPGRRSSR